MGGGPGEMGSGKVACRDVIGWRDGGLGLGSGREMDRGEVVITGGEVRRR